MKPKKIIVCPICGKDFEKVRPDRKYCSRRCSNIAANRSKRARRKEEREKYGTD